MNIIFLDIDGVMNSNVFYQERYNKPKYKIKRVYYWIKSWIRLLFTGSRYKLYSIANYTPNPKHSEFKYCFDRLKEETDPLKWKWLSQFCNENDYKICISSVWKNNFEDPRDWHAALSNLGFNGASIFWGITPNLKSRIRGEEIAKWLSDHPKFTKYAILDDDSDMLPEQMPSFFLVDRYYGLTPNHLYRIKRHFDKVN